MKFILPVILMATICGCKKDNNDFNPYLLSNDQLAGTWKFGNITVSTYDTTTNKFEVQYPDVPNGAYVIQFTNDSTGSYFHAYPSVWNYLPANGQWSLDIYSSTIYFKCLGNECTVPNAIWTISDFSSSQTAGAMNLQSPTIASGGKLITIIIGLAKQ
ncbi:MAG: hypothetical protein BGO55_14925 [Sphingobacteriales bacterium 50-39]|nr:hypothetical protein [Sphingobacteriales bacterium]OJW57571.1 MAG: hypothetical protein BGO55_14925 [Sphingobacteriales bacterium 50-39]